MRILHVIPAVAPRYGGPSVAVIEMCRSLAARGHDVQLATTDADGPGRLDVARGSMTSYSGVPSIFFAAHFGEALKASPGLGAWLRRSVQAFDVVHVHAVFSHASVAAARACRRAGIPYIVRPLGSLDPWSVSRKSWRKRVFLATVGRQLVEGAALLHFTTEQERDLAQDVVAAHRSIVIPLGIPDGLLQEPLSDPAGRDPVVATVTRLDVKKNLEALTRGFLKATEAAGATAWKLVIAGDGDPRVRSALERLAADHRARVELTGWLDERERRNLLRRAALFALPSFQENFGLSVAEALAEGTPVLVSKGVNLASAIAEAGAGWVTGTSEDEIASTLSAVLACGELTVRAGNARRLAGSYRWSVVTEQLERAYSGVAAEHGRVTLPATA